MGIERYPHVFESIKIGPVEIKNRFYVPPHGLHVMSVGGPHGSLVPSADWAYYLAERAKGGAGLVFLTMTAYSRIRGISPIFEESLPNFTAVAGLAHRHGAKIFAQLHMREGGVPWEPRGAMAPQIAPSDEQNFAKHTTNHAMTAREIKEWIDAQGRCARYLTGAGFDGIELHVTHGMILEMFLSPFYNKRTDEYGGSLENRLRVIVESLREVRRSMGAHMALGIRLQCDEHLPGGLTPKDSREALEKLVEWKLIDFVDMDMGEVGLMGGHLGYGTQYQEPGYQVQYSGQVAAGVKGKVVRMGIGGRINSVAQVETILASGALDMVGAVRQSMAEPEFIKNAIEGREDRSRTCIAINFCISREANRPPGVGAGCLINPATTREERWGVGTFTPATRPSKVVIAGAGPAGLEAARVAAKMGHQVVVLERSKAVGGQLNLWADLPYRDVLHTTVEWYRRQLDELGVQVRTGTAATATAILAEKPDAVLVATGSRYVATGESAFVSWPIPGADQQFVYTPEQILEDGARPTGRVLLLDEERIHTGWGIAEVLANAGAQVEIVTRDLHLAGDAISNSYEFAYIIPRLRKLGVKITIGTYLRQIGDHRATVYDVLTNEEETRAVDAVVLATMRRSDPALANELEGRVAQLFVIGDAMAPRYLFEATYEGQRFARLVAQEGAPRDMTEALAIFTPAPAEVFPRPASRLLEEGALEQALAR